MHVQIAAVPAGADLERGFGKAGDGRGLAAAEADGGGVVGFAAFADVGDAEQQRPAPGRQRAGQVGGGGVDGGDGEARLVAAAPAAEPMRIEEAEIDDGLLFPARVFERDGQPVHALGHIEPDLAIGLMIGAGDDAGEDDGVLGVARFDLGCQCHAGLHSTAHPRARGDPGVLSLSAAFPAKKPGFPLSRE